VTDTVVLIHGFATSSERTWRETGWIDLLGDLGKTVVAVDLPGHGTADKPHDPEAYSDIVGAVLSQAPDHPVDIVGFSQGARTALDIACEHPHRVNRLVVAGVGANLFTSASPEPLALVLDGTNAPDTPVANHFAALANDPGQDPVALAAFLRRPGTEPITAERLATVNAETLVVLGTDDFVGPADELMAALPNARLVELPGVDHFATPKNFGFLDAALEFLT
jgi:pimeloyl-ACP methyl ester carboxylesterase